MDSAKESQEFTSAMAKRSPEKLAAALRANLRRRKQPSGRTGPSAAGDPPPAAAEKSVAEPPVKPPKNGA